MKTVTELTTVMNNLEKIIQFFNQKYHFDIGKAPEPERRAYQNLLKRWDNLKSKRDRIKLQTSKKATL